MKNYIFYSIITAGTLLVSCKKDWVDTTPNGLPLTTSQWEGEVNVVKGINALYEPMTDESTFGRELFWMQNASDDLITGRDRASAKNIKDFTATGREGDMTAPWNQLYWMLNKANAAIGGLPNATGIGEELRTRSLGEAYFMRGFAHFWLAYLWGHEKQGVPYDAIENPEFGKRIPPQLKSVTDNYAAIVADMQKAAELLPLFKTYNGPDRGRAHKAAALGYLVKTYAYWAQYDASKWEPVPALCDRIKMEGERALITNKATARKNYEAVFSIENNWSSEYIWSVTSGNRGGSIFPGVVLENKGWGAYNGWGYFQPTEELYQEYEPNDPRREVTILKFGDSLRYFGEDILYSSTNSRSGFQIRKYMEPFSYGFNGDAKTNEQVNPNGDAPSTALNLPLIRYAEILLFKAEALIEMDKSGEAAAPLNEVRARVGLAPVASPTMDDLKHERRCELACEWTDRTADLKRWNDVAKINAPLHGRIHTSQTDPNSPYTVKEVWPARNYSKSKIAWPIPPDEISRSNGVYKQTPGW